MSFCSILVCSLTTRIHDTFCFLCIHSGGHLNPAVTLGVFCTGTLSPGVALGYVAAQLLGGITASGLAKVCLLCHCQLHSSLKSFLNRVYYIKLKQAIRLL